MPKRAAASTCREDEENLACAHAGAPDTRTCAVPQINLTALERMWAYDAANKQPALDDAYTVQGFDPEKLDQSVIDTIPTPTGWRIAILPYRGAEKTKGGIVLAEETQRKTQLSTVSKQR